MNNIALIAIIMAIILILVFVVAPRVVVLVVTTSARRARKNVERKTSHQKISKKLLPPIPVGVFVCESAYRKVIRLWIGFIQRQPLTNGGSDYIDLINCDKTAVVLLAAKALKAS